MPQIPSDRNVPGFEHELVKLLVQVAWADHEVAPEEVQRLLAFAEQGGLSEAERAALEAALSGKAPLSPPNLGLLRQRRTDTLRAVKQLLFSDQKLTQDEQDVFDQIAALLG